MSWNATVALALCLGGALLEGLCAGLGVRQRLEELKSPSFSPPLWAWYAIGVVYYVIVFVCAYRILQHSAPELFRNAALILLVAVVVLNALWNLLFFRAKNLRATFFFSLSYSIVAIACWYCLLRLDALAASVLGVYAVYLLYATVWGYRLWRINSRGDQ
jgi:benzodiazapine receptor